MEHLEKMSFSFKVNQSKFEPCNTTKLTNQIEMIIRKIHSKYIINSDSLKLEVGYIDDDILNGIVRLRISYFQPKPNDHEN